MCGRPSVGDVTVEIRDVTSGEPNSTIFGTKVFANSLISPTTPSVEALTTFDLQSLNLQFNAGDELAIVVRSTNQSGSLFPIRFTAGDAYTGGSAYISADGASWFPFAGKDARFRTFVEDPVQIVDIDIKPGSDPNCFNANGHGVIPVAILGSETFFVTDIDPSTLLFGGLEVRVRGNKGPLCHVDYSNGDTVLDLVCQFVDDPTNWDPGEGTATLTGTLPDGTEFEGTDSICAVPPEPVCPPNTTGVPPNCIPDDGEF